MIGYKNVRLECFQHLHKLIQRLIFPFMQSNSRGYLLETKLMSEVLLCYDFNYESSPKYVHQ